MDVWTIKPEVLQEFSQFAKQTSWFFGSKWNCSCLIRQTIVVERGKTNPMGFIVILPVDTAIWNIRHVHLKKNSFGREKKNVTWEWWKLRVPKTQGPTFLWSFSRRESSCCGVPVGFRNVDPTPNEQCICQPSWYGKKTLKIIKWSVSLQLMLVVIPNKTRWYTVNCINF